MVELKPAASSSRSAPHDVILARESDAARATVDATDQESVDLLLRRIPGKLDTIDAVYLFVCAAAYVLLRQQARIDNVTSSGQFGLQQHELILAALHPFLKDCGYALRNCYAPGWRNTDSTPDRQHGLEYTENHPDAEPMCRCETQGVPSWS